nr:hypothetical protein BaRGS_018249 [Batillaria attramentaria]
MLDKFLGDSAGIYSNGNVGLDETPLIMYLVLGIMTQSAILIIINSLILRRFHGNQSVAGAKSWTAENLDDTMSQYAVAGNVPEQQDHSQDLKSKFILRLDWKDTALSWNTHFPNGAEWTLESERVEKKMLTPAFPYLEYVWTLKRKTTYFVISFIVPIVLTSYMNTLVFIIPADSGEKISYLVSIFVSNAVFVSFCLDETPLIMCLVLGIMTQSAILIVINSLILRRFHGNAADQRRYAKRDWTVRN